MSLMKEIEADFIEAYKNKEALKVSVLRMLKSSLQNKKIEQGRELLDEEVVAVIKKEIKSRKDSAQDYIKGERKELAEKELAEVDFLEKYLPKQLSEAEIEKIVDETAKELGAKNLADMGKVIGATMDKVGASADGATVSKVVKQKLS